MIWFCKLYIKKKKVSEWIYDVLYFPPPWRKSGFTLQSMWILDFSRTNERKRERKKTEVEMILWRKNQFPPRVWKNFFLYDIQFKLHHQNTQGCMVLRTFRDLICLRAESSWCSKFWSSLRLRPSRSSPIKFLEKKKPQTLLLYILLIKQYKQPLFALI